MATLVSFRKQIDEAEAARKADSKRLMVLLQGFEDRVIDAFGISPQTLFNCLSQLAYIGESPFNAGAHSWQVDNLACWELNPPFEGRFSRMNFSATLLLEGGKQDA